MKRHDETLLWRYAARELDAEEAALTEHHLSECVECRERLLDVRQARLVLQDAQTPRPRVEWGKVDQSIAQLVEARLVAKAKPSRVGWKWPAAIGFVGACAAALLAVSGGSLRLDLLRQPEVVMIEAPAPTSSQVELALGLSRVGAVLAAATEGDKLMAGEVLRTSVGGRALLTLPDGSRMRLGGGTQLALTRTEADDVALTLERGRVGVHASHRSRRGFVVHANGMSVRVIGTLFTVSQVAGVLEVAVAEGKVAVEPPEGAPLMLGAGERVRFERGGWKALRGNASAAQLGELADLSAPPLLEAAGTPRAPAAGKLPAGALARRDDPASRNGAVQQSGQLVGVALASPEPSPPVHAEGLLPRKAPAAPGAATVWPGGQPQLAGPAVQDQALPPLEEKASVWPSLGGGPTTYEPRVRQGAQQPAAPIAGPVTAAPEVAAPAAAPDFSDWPQAQPAPKAQPATHRAEPLPEDLEALFLQRAERGLERGICERYLMGLQEIASDASRNERAQTARILRARCYDARVRPDLSEIEYRRYLEVWPKGRHSDEARKAVIE